jgi:hypothetical protein
MKPRKTPEVFGFSSPALKEPTPSSLGQGLDALLSVAARSAQAQGKLDEAMDDYLAELRLARRDAVYHGFYMDFGWSGDEQRLRAWAAAPGQTAERVATMLREVTKLTEPPVSRTLDLVSYYQHVRDLIDGNATAMASERLYPADVTFITLWNRWLPWERERALRVLDWFTYDDLTACRQLEDALARSEGSPPLSAGTRYAYGRRQPELTLALSEHLYRQFDRTRSWFGTDQVVASAARRREVRLVLAIEASKLKNGHLPKTLAELVGPYLKDVPHDPYTGEPFRYFPEGLPLPLWRRSFPDSASPEVRLEAHKPFLWSAGARVRLADTRETDFRRYEILEEPYWRYDSDHWHKPVTEQDVWLAGRVYVLP